MEKIVKKSDINITVGLNEENVPVSIHWKAEDNPSHVKPAECKAMLLSLFDRDHFDTLKIDLWTKDMQVNEMDRFFYQTFRAMCDTYFRATQNGKLANEMQRFVQYFGEQTEIIPKENPQK